MEQRGTKGVNRVSRNITMQNGNAKRDLNFVRTRSTSYTELRNLITSTLMWDNKKTETSHSTGRSHKKKEKITSYITQYTRGLALSNLREARSLPRG